jgi:uncharacterized protein (DUF736 family)
MSNKQSDGAAWKKTINTKNGSVEILSITIGDKRYTAWPNTYKQEGDKSPDYRLSLDTYDASKTKAKPAEKSFAGQQEDLPF